MEALPEVATFEDEGGMVMLPAASREAMYGEEYIRQWGRRTQYGRGD